MSSAKIVWLSLLASQAVIGVVLIAGAARVRDTPIDLPTFPFMLGLVATVTIIGAHLCWRRASWMEGRREESALQSKSLALSMIAWALDESVAIYGLLLGVLAFSPTTWAPFSVLALAATWAHRPQ